MRFIKMHGIGNDYVYINGYEQSPPTDAAALAELAKKISDRHFGVGSDGLILVVPPEQGVDAHVRMRMFNADGSEAEMCGNGIRCVCKLAHDAGICRQRPMRIQTGSGVLSLAYATGGDGKVDTVTVDMGEPILDAAKIPVRIEGIERVVNHKMRYLIDWPQPNGWIKKSGLDQRMTCVSMGNPHVVLYCSDLDVVPLQQAGSLIERHNVFPNRTNVHFVRVHDEKEVTVLHWERGSGATLACGTGACAVCVAGVLTDRTARKITAHLPGGDLQLEWRAPHAKEGANHVFMTGPATYVFEGEFQI